MARLGPQEPAGLSGIGFPAGVDHGCGERRGERQDGPLIHVLILPVDMHFLPDVFIRCPVCHGRRFKPEVLAVRYGGTPGYDIAEVLDMTIAEALPLFADVPAARSRLALMAEVGVGTCRRGRPRRSQWLCGGVCQEGSRHDNQGSAG